MVAMRARAVLSVLVLVVAVGIVASQVVSEEPPKKEEPKPDASFGAEAMGQMMAEYAKWGALGEQHKEFAKAVGDWETTCRIYMAPGVPPMESKGTATFKTILGGRFLVQEYKSEMMGQPYEGMGIEGYDNFKKKYVSIWMDSMSTGIWSSAGDCDSTGKTCTYYGAMDDPVTGVQDKMGKMVVRVVDDDKHMFDMYELLPDGTEKKCMDIEYTRRK
jgi:hypothetical protein